MRRIEASDNVNIKIQKMRLYISINELGCIKYLNLEGSQNDLYI